MDTVMLQFRHRGMAPGLDEVAALFGLAPGEIDATFGVIATDPAEGLYTVRIDVRGADRVRAALAQRPADPAEGLFANPPIAPFGPPED
ncbi:hypothetical protein [Erythrobacter tepidarius]|uniref:hypothetical protein n=1 Tax=Erythrobacter tepidarius TaxID=60454 RepID=UPI000A3BB6AF|nr:hypothetical protein [Erythrobacter tepidarius]